MKKITVADRTLCRDEGSYSFKERLEIARRLEGLCIDAIELPEIASEREDTLLIKTVASFVKNAVISVAAGSNAASVALAAAALRTAEKPRIRIELPVSPATMEYQYHKKPPKMLEYISALVAAAKAEVADVEFCARFASDAEPEFVRDALAAAVSAGAGIVTVSDENALMSPDEFARFAANAAKDIDATLGVLCSDKYGYANASALLSIRDSASCVKTAVDGGVTSLEDFASLLQARGDHLGLSSGLKYTQIHRTVRQILWIADSSSKDENPAPSAHVDENVIRLDAGDDRAALDSAVAKLGYDLSEEDKAKVYEEFLRVAEKKTVGAKELDAIVASTALQVPAAYKLISYVTNSGNVISASAQITLEKNGKTMQGVCLGDGPVDAAFRAVEQIIGRHYELDDFQITAVTEGRDSVGNAVVKLRNNGKLYSGSGISTNIIGASIRAYLNAVNKIAYEEE